MPTHKKNREYISFTKALRQHGSLTLWVCFDSLKNNTQLINGRYADLSGGFIRRKEIELHAKRLKLKPETLVKKLNEMVRQRWAEKTKTGYRLKSWKFVATMYGFDEFKVRCVIGSSKKQFNQNAAYTEIKSYMNQGVHSRFKEINKREKVSKRLLKFEAKLSVIRSYEDRENVQEKFNPTPSVRQLAKALGFKSPSTISKINQNLKARNLIDIKKNNEFACMTENYPLYIRGNSELVGHHYRSKNDLGLVVMRRKKQTIFLK